jgi:ribosomal-protein-alanine N-acetyltransferase
VEGLLRLEAACFRGVYAAHRWNRAQFLYYVGHPSARVGVVCGSDGIEGYVAGFLSESGRDPDALLYSIAVASAARRLGHGSRLLGWFVGHARRAQCGAVVLEVSVTRRDARRLFEARGFRAGATLRDYYGPGRDALRMRKPLTPRSRP